MRIGVPGPEDSGLSEAVAEAGGEPVPVSLPSFSPRGGVALRREWVADWVEAACEALRVEALLLEADRNEDLAGLLLAALRLDIPAVLASSPSTPLSAALAALGFWTFGGEQVGVLLSEPPRSRGLVDSFSLSNALHAGLALGGGPEMLVHLAAFANETDSYGFSQMARVLAPERPAIADTRSSWFREHGLGGVLALLDDIHDVSTLGGDLKTLLPDPPPPTPPERTSPRILFVSARGSGTETVALVPKERDEVLGWCRTFTSEEAAAAAVRDGELEEGDILVVQGCGPHGGPGLLRLDELGRAIEESGEEVPVFTDGLPPEGAGPLWFSLTTPEASEEGMIGHLQDGDYIRFDLREERIRVGVKAHDLELRTSPVESWMSGSGYAARYSRSALPPLEGAGFD